MKKIIFLIGLIFPITLFAQTEKFPTFKTCIDQDSLSLENCFYLQTKIAFFKEFKEPKILADNKFKGSVNAVFIVTNEGNFKLIYVNSPYKELEEEVDRVFKTFEIIEPATYNNKAVEMRFTLPISFPALNIHDNISVAKTTNTKQDFNEYVKVAKDSSFNNQFNSQLNIPFTHLRYVDYEYNINKAVGTHTAVKPYSYSYVNTYFDLEAEREQFLKPDKDTWLEKKIWNEHLLEVTGDGYWFNLDFLLDVQLGKDNSNVSYTFNNSRILTVNGGLGDKFSFSTTVYESQGRFAGYVNDYISNPSSTFRPAFSEGLVPGRGKAKGFKTDAYDYPVAEGYLAYTPNKFLQFQFGNGKNFIGDGYRSLLLSDVSSPNPYLKMNVNFWKFSYSNIWLWATDVTAPAVVNKEHARKYVAMHYLSINVNDRLNIGLFETAISRGDKGFDVGFLNPLIFYRSVEFGRGEDAGNAMLGVTAKYKLKENIMLYSQLIIDEFSFGKIGDLGYWGNKFGIQLGAKYFNAFDIDKLFLQAEFNTVRPYTFAHKDPVLNFGNYSQPLGHAWGANFWEAIAISSYKFDRWTGSAKLLIGQKGFDTSAGISYGGDIYKSYDIRKGDNDNSIAQGNTTTIFLADVQARYLLNASNNLSLFGGLTFRSFSPKMTTPTFKSESSIWLSVGIKADLFNWYLDF